MEPPETDMLLESKGHAQQDKWQPRMRKGSHQPHIVQRVDLQNIQKTQETGHQKYK